MINIEKLWDKVSDNASETLNIFLEECLAELKATTGLYGIIAKNSVMKCLKV
jgi:hypothetical protein